MAIWSRIKKLSLKQLFLLVKTFVKYPIYFFPTQRATTRTMAICDKLFGKAHHKNNATNAFRHALWNILIAYYCYQKNNSVEKSVRWAKTITDLHEKIAPNIPIETTMDLHNNAIGRQLFIENKLHIASENDVVDLLLKKLKSSVLVSSIDDINKQSVNFVHLELA